MLNSRLSSGLFVVAIMISAMTTACAKAGDPQDRIQKLENEVEELKSLLKQQPSGKLPNTAGQSIVNVVRQITPSVVSIHAAKTIGVNPHQYFNPFEDFFFGDPYNQQRKKPEPRKYRQQGLGSGVIIDKEGHVITNFHVAGEADEIKITLTDDREFEAEVIGSDKLSDVAVLKIKKPPKDLPIAPIGNSDNLEVGETVIAVGSPFGYSNTVTAGILSAKGRTVGINSYENYLQTDASINPGNSGGALVNLSGELIGINTAIASRSGASNGIGFAIPINMAKDIMDDLLNKGSVVRGYLGVYLQELDQNLQEAFGLNKSKGALVSGVIEDSPAEKSGLKEGDVIIEADGAPIKDVNHLRNLVAQLDPDKTCAFTIIRDGEKKTIKVKVGTRDPEETAASSKESDDSKLGLTLETITPELVQRFNLSKEAGVIVTNVKEGSNAEKSGIQPGDIILTFDRETIKKVKDFLDAASKSKKETALVIIERRGMKQYIGLKLK